MITFEKGKYIAYYLGNPNINCHIDAVHSKRPQGEINTKKLVIEIIKNTDCSGIYALTSRMDMDLNRPLNEVNKPAILEFRETILSILKNLKILDRSKKLIKPYLHLALHGMKNYAHKEIEIGTRNNQTCSNEIFVWFQKKLEENCKEVFNKDLRIVYNKEFIGDTSKGVHRKKYGNLFNTIQIEINKTLRKHYFSKIVEVLTKIVKEFYQEYN
ncbi:hypothetical protein ES705_23988 [subsurface metagenome]